jgi:macrolide-specific efflux system membrane fusion protein
MKLGSFLRRRRKRTWIATGGVIAVVAAGSIYWFGFGPTTGSQTALAASTTATATLQTIEQTVSATGALAPTSEEDVDFVASGTVTAVNVTAGSTVTAGETLATVDTLTENANLLTAKATLASAQSELASATASSSGSSSDLAQIAADAAAVTVAQAGVTAAQTEYDGTTLVAPIAGLVTAVNLEVGDVVSGGSSSGSSAPSSDSSSSTGSTSGSTGSTSGSTGTTTSSSDFTIIGTGSWDVSVSLSASDIKDIKVGQQVDLSTDENASFFGTVASIGLLPSTTTGAATYPVVVSVTGSPDDLYDGVTATAKIIYEKRTDVLTVPSAAVTTANGVSTVQKVTNGKTVKTTVTTGETSGNLIEITKGLSKGDVVSETLFTPGTGNTGTGTGTGTRGNFGGGTGGTGGTGGYGGTGGTGGYGGGNFGGGTGGTRNANG